MVKEKKLGKYRAFVESKQLIIIVIYVLQLCLRSTNRTNACARTAVNASISIDYILTVAFANSTYRTFSCTCTTADAIIINSICHDIAPPYILVNYFTYPYIITNQLKIQVFLVIFFIKYIYNYG